MNKLIYSFIIFFFSTIILLPAQVTFYKNYLQEVDDREVFNMTQVYDGGYALLGITATENANDEVGVTRLDCRGKVLWARKYGPSTTINNVFGKIIEADNGDLVLAYAVGSFQNYDILVSRLSTDNGDVIWSKRLGGNRDDVARDIVQAANGDFILVGGTSSFGTDTGGSPTFTDVYLLRLDGDGNVLWSKTYGNQGQIDAGYAMIQSPDGNLYITGRYLVGGTFYAFLMKTDEAGNPEFMKGYGAPNHRTYGYGITASEDWSSIAITGSTTIDKVDFNSWADPFFIKTDLNGDTIFNRIYYPWLGDDRSESGSSIISTVDGRFAIAVPTMSFTTHSLGFVPNKNAIYVLNDDGSLNLAKIYNQGGSHYSHINKTANGEILLSNFSNFFSPTFEFLPLIIKMDQDFNVGCNEIDVTSELSIAIHTWDQQDITAVESTGTTSNDLNAGNDFGYSSIDTQCENIPEVSADFSFNGFCIGDPVVFSQLSSGVITEYIWNFGDGDTAGSAEPTHIYEEDGVFNVELIVSNGCNLDTLSQEIEILPFEMLQSDTAICEGEEVFIGGALQSEAGFYQDTLEAVDFCKIILTTELIVETCNCNVEFPNTFTPNGDMINDVFGVVTDCEGQISDFKLKIFNRWGEVIFETNNFMESWDGHCGSEHCPADIYMAYAEYGLELDGLVQAKTWQGDITLMR